MPVFRNAEADTSTGRPEPFETILVAILLEQEKALTELRSKIEGQKFRLAVENKGKKEGLPKRFYFVPWKPSLFEIWM